MRYVVTDEQLEAILEHAEAGYTVEDISELVFRSRRQRDIKRVAGVLRETDPVPDPVALERAASGDRSAWESLTPLERDMALVAVRRRRMAEMAERREWVDIFRRHAYGASGGEGLPHELTPAWFVRMAEAAGYRTTDKLMREARRAEARLGKE